jgi:protease I
MTRLLIPVPSYGFDPTEVAIPWKIFTGEGIDVVFTTPNGDQPSTDSSMLDGNHLGIWKSVLRARQDAVDAHSELITYDSFCQPMKYAEAKVDDFDALFLPGGHDKRVKEYLESEVLHSLVGEFFAAEKPVGAICHGVVLAARSKNPDTGKSAIYDYKTTALLKSQELTAYNMTRLWLKDYYLTYPGLTVEDEVRSVLSDAGNFKSGPTPVLRDDLDHLERGFVVSDRNYLSARWPGDAYSISIKMVALCADN